MLAVFRAYAPDRDITNIWYLIWYLHVHRIWVGSGWRIHWRLGFMSSPLREKNLRLLQCLLSRQILTAQHSAQKITLGMPHRSQSLIKFVLEANWEVLSDLPVFYDPSCVGTCFVLRFWTTLPGFSWLGKVWTCSHSRNYLPFFVRRPGPTRSNSEFSWKR